MSERMHIYVCVTCRASGADGRSPDRPGARLHASLSASFADDPQFHVVAVECLSVCKRPCTIGFAAPGKWTYLYGDLSEDGGADIVRAGARLYAAAPDGIIPWRERPSALKKGVVARFPPIASLIPTQG